MSLVTGYGPYLVAAWIFGWGLYGIVSSKNLVHLVICLGVVQTSTYVMLMAAGFVAGGVAPIFLDVAPGTRAVDPVVQALMLTDVVVEATVVALLLVFAVRAHQGHGTLDPAALRPMRG